MYEKLVKVIDALEHCVKIDCNHCPYSGDDNGGWNCHEMQNEALELLKEQSEIVRCKDCVHWDKECTEECDNTDSVCFHNGRCKPDWFCADGERREE